jgi:GTP cyclohydrolase II
MQCSCSLDLGQSVRRCQSESTMHVSRQVCPFQDRFAANPSTLVLRTQARDTRHLTARFPVSTCQPGSYPVEWPCAGPARDLNGHAVRSSLASVRDQQACMHSPLLVARGLKHAVGYAEVLGSLKCDCAQQLQLALEYIREHPPGMVIYLQQEGRGIGLANKIAAYSLQVRE